MVALFVAFLVFDVGHFFTLAYFKSQQATISEYQAAYPLQTAAIFILIYVVLTALSFPGATVMTLVAGAVFGLWWGTLIVSFASSIGATLAFIAARFVLRDSIQRKFGDRLAAINAGIEKEGPFYLFTLRLVPVFPFFVINLAMGLTPIKTWTFYWVSQLGMLAGTIVYVNAGTELAKINSLSGILSPALLASFVLLGFFPLLAKWFVNAVKARRIYARWPKPKRFDRNVIVIGAGSAGLVTAYIAAAVKARVTLVEKFQMGGDCLNTGCVPSKALIRTAKFLSDARRANEFGITSARVDFDFAQVMERVQRIVTTIAPHDSVERYTKLGVDCLIGEAKITSPWSVDVITEAGKRTLTTKNIVIAAGGRPFIPPIPGLREINPLTSDTLWGLRKLPARLVVLGGGPIGCELAQCFARFGSKVTQVELLPRLMVREDADVSTIVMGKFNDEDITVLVEHKAARVEIENEQKFLVAEHGGKETRIPFDELLCAVGRAANVTGYGLEELGIPTNKARTVELNEYLQTNYPNIYAAGDVAGPFQFTHTASHMAWYAAVNALFGRFRKFKVDYSVIPWATFTDPEVARVGLNEQEAREKNIACEVSRYPLSELDRAVTDEEAHGFVKVLTTPGSDRILGATIVGEHAGDLIAEFVVAMKHGLGLNKILGTIHTYPTLAESAKFAAGVWKKAHVTQGQLDFLAAFNTYMRDDSGIGPVLGRLPALIRDKRPVPHGDAEGAARTS
ncbi:MAG: associated Golgi protein [Betaproteobacteria bacterium]|nr:associated Golgi protein [Betaproteobacteria bacterium]